MILFFKSILLLLLSLSTLCAHAERVCKYPPPQRIPSDLGQFEICAEIFKPQQAGVQITLNGWSGWIYRNGTKQNNTAQQSWQSNIDGLLGTGEKLTTKLTAGTHTITLTNQPGVENYEVKATITITVGNKPK